MIKRIALEAAKAVLVEGIVISMEKVEDAVEKEISYKLPFVFVCGVLVGVGLGLRVKPVMVFR